MSHHIELAGKVAFVTGASSGLGAQFAKTLAAQGATVVLASRRVERLKELRAEIEVEGGTAHVVSLDVTDRTSIAAAVAHAETEAGPIDILINNSGVASTQRLVDATEADYDFVFGTNTKGAFFMAQEVAKRMILRAKANPSRQARVINIASMAGLRVLPKIGVYCMNKAAVIQMTKAMAMEWGAFNINVTAVCPGYIRTEINEAHWTSEAGQKLVNMLPRKRVGDPKDLDGLILYLASDSSHFVNGSVIAADDGFGI